MFDATTWTFIGLVIFLALLVYLKVPGFVTKALDARADKIRNELEEARRLREEAQQMLAEYQRKRQDAEKEAEEIVTAAKNEAEQIAVEAKEKTEEYVARRTAMAEQKIAQAEADAVNDVRNASVDLAIEAAGKLLGDKMSAKNSGDLFKDALAQVKTNLN